MTLFARAAEEHGSGRGARAGRPSGRSSTSTSAGKDDEATTRLL